MCSVLLSGCALAHGALFDPLLNVVQLHDTVDEDAGGDDVVRINLAILDQFLDLHHHLLTGGRHDRIKVPRRLPVDEVASWSAFQAWMTDRSARRPRSITYSRPSNSCCGLPSAICVPAPVAVKK